MRGRDREPGAVGHHRVGGHRVRLRRQLGERGNDRLDELIAVERDAHLGPTVGRALDDPERQVVEQLVGEHDPVERRRPGARRAR